MMPKLRNRRDSAAHKIAAQLKAAEAGPRRAARAQLQLSAIAASAGAQGTMVGHYLRPDTDPSRPPMQAITAAAEIVSGPTTTGKRKTAPRQPWQQESWELRGEVGEFRFSGDRPARAVSLCSLYPARTEGSSREPSRIVEPDPKANGQEESKPQPLTPAEADAYMIAEDLFGSVAATQQALKRCAQHLVFNGESLIVISQTDEDGLRWDPWSTTELTESGSGWKLDTGLGARDLAETDVVVRVWIPDPEKQAYADCAAKAVLPVVRELKGLTQFAGAQIDSRLAGAGLLLVPDNIEVLAGQTRPKPTSDDPEDASNEAYTHPFVDALVEAMTIPIGDRESAAAVVPLVVKMAIDAIDKVKHITFGGGLDEHAAEMRDESIKRLALGMDSAPETLTGLGSANHWSAWQVSEDEVSLVVAPLITTICHALTRGFFQPALRQLGHFEANDFQLWFDTAALALRPDRSADAKALYEQDALSLLALIRENGFDEADIPTSDERDRKRVWRLLMAKPDYAPQLLPYLGIDIDGGFPAPAAPAPGGEPEPAPDGEEPPAPGPSPDGPPERDLEEPDNEVTAP